MGKLFLSGGGSAEQTVTIDRIFVSEIERERPLLYLPIAMDAADYKDCFRWINDTFNPLGINEVVLWTNVHKKRVEDLNDFSAIYIGGGNTFILLKRIMESKFDKVLKSYLDDGGVVYGGSAGAIIFGNNIMTSAHLDSNTVKVNNFKGIGMVGNYSVWCHFKKDNDHLINRFVEEYDSSVIALPEETAIFINGSETKVIGTEPAYIFTEKGLKTISIGDFSL
ncbi:Type 1 glutamine amidotransferase-like domain-containing protein [Terribacillus sp. 179-K 1B1 HS]|uniref:Type 1 glutamine amidotransferase-like domain-containing protein n=1 Tax=Terribacillus sp. 179-K 1B1 HS TaxID=3142388 RepID=UPI0039A02B38